VLFSNEFSASAIAGFTYFRTLLLKEHHLQQVLPSSTTLVNALLYDCRYRLAVQRDCFRLMDSLCLIAVAATTASLTLS
jgi:hypothetical protein